MRRKVYLCFFFPSSLFLCLFREKIRSGIGLARGRTEISGKNLRGGGFHFPRVENGRERGDILDTGRIVWVIQSSRA
jgi:hypothetical protein